MLGFLSDSRHDAKCSITHGTMGHLDPSQPPTKRKPFVSVLNYHFIQKVYQDPIYHLQRLNRSLQVQLILPEELYEIIKNGFITQHSSPRYSRVIMPLGALLEGEFFNEYIKRGNVLMLSEWRTGVDKLYSLREGMTTDLFTPPLS